MKAAHDRATPGWLIVPPALALAVLFIVPFAIMVGISFAHRVESAFFEPGLELTSYMRVLSPLFGRVLLVSLSLSATAALVCVGLAFPFVICLASFPRKAQTVILVLLLCVLSLSEVVTGFALSTLLSQTAGIGNVFAWLGLTSEAVAYAPSQPALIAGLCYIGFPYAVLMLYPPVSRLDPELPEAARMLGASPLRAFFNVTVPVLRTPILGALVLVFVFTLGSYVLPQVLGRAEDWTLSVHITDQAVFQSNLPLAAALAVVLLIVSLALVGLTLLIGGEKGGRP